MKKEHMRNIVAIFTEKKGLDHNPSWSNLCLNTMGSAVKCIFTNDEKFKINQHETKLHFRPTVIW